VRVPHTQETGSRRKRYMTTLWKTLCDDEGATMVEYGIMVALIAAVCITVITTLGQNVSNAFSTVNTSI
jgi:pilus assembly protein Flp/PilA